MDRSQCSFRKGRLEPQFSQFSNRSLAPISHSGQFIRDESLWRVEEIEQRVERSEQRVDDFRQRISDLVGLDYDLILKHVLVC